MANDVQAGSSSFRSEASRREAVRRRDHAADGHFIFAVKTTGVYCRPSCGARAARRENVSFFDTAAGARRAGFRACKRCKPDEPPSHDREAEAVIRACAAIAKASEPPTVDALAAAAGLSTSHFHRLFKRTTGLTPKAYAGATRANRLRESLAQSTGVTPAMHRAGFNASSRLYAAAPQALGMTPGDYRAGGRGITIRFALGKCSLGSILVAATTIGVCAIALGDDPAALRRWLEGRFFNAELIGGDRAFERTVAHVVAFVERPQIGLGLPLDIRGTAFQQRVWLELMKIPAGSTRTYAQIARSLGTPSATRAVGTACGANPIAVAIPCHRVVRSDGSLAGYAWGVGRKASLLNAERSRRDVTRERSVRGSSR